MRFGPTSLQLSSVLAKGLRHPKLRGDLKVSEQQVAGEASFLIKDPDTATYNRYGPTEYELLTMCDGTRTPAEVAAAMTELHPEAALDEGAVLDFLDTVDPNLWERSVGEKNLAMLERIRDERKGRVDHSSLLYIQFKAWNPNRTLARLDPYLSWIYTRGFAIFSVVAFVVALSILAGDWARVQHDTLALYSFSNMSAADIWSFWIILFSIGGIHEFAHGLTCKHFGGDVPQMGFLLIYFTPAFYTDTTDILLFDRATPRQLTLFAGIWIELVICSISTFAWALTLPGSFANQFAYKMLLLTGITGVLGNANPFIKADGYYALSQFLQMDSLREDSFEFLRGLLRKYVLRQQVELPPTSRRQRRIFTTYGILASLYSYSLLIFVFIWAYNVLTSKFGGWGYVALAGGLYLMLRARIRKAVPHIRAWFWRTREEYMRWKITRGQQIIAAAAVLILFIPPFSRTVSSEFILEPGVRADVRPSVSGELLDVRVHPGDPVHAGDILAELRNPDVEANATILAGQLGLAESALRNAEQHSARSDEARASGERARLATELSVARAKAAGLVLRAPVDGVVATTSGLPPRSGDYLAEGQEFLRVVDRSSMRARILVRDWDLEDVRVGAPVQLKVTAEPYRTYEGHVERILPAASIDRPVSDPTKLERRGQEVTNYFAVEMEFPNSDGSLREGMTGTAKISGVRRPLAWKAAKAGWQWIRSQMW